MSMVQRYGRQVLRKGLWLCAFCCLSFSAHASDLKASDKTASATSVIAASEISQFFLDNGLEVIVIPNHRVPAVSHMLWYRVGAADDPVGKSGLAHFHEHLMFQGTKTTQPGEYAKIIAARGGEQNAFTGRDATSYYVNIRKEELPLAMKLEADRMIGIIPTAKKAESEREVIIEERRMRVDNEPSALLSEQSDAAMFRHHPYRIPVIGWQHEMATLTLEDVLTFHTTYYHPNNAILIVSGDVTEAEVRKLAEEYYGPIPKGVLPIRNWLKEPPQNVARRVSLRHENVRKASWSRDYVSPSLAYGEKKHALPLYLLAQLIGGGKTSNFYKTLVVDKKLATQVGAYYNGLTLGPAQFSIYAVPAEDVSLDALEKGIEEVMSEFLKQAPDEKAFARAKTLLKAQTLYSRDGLSNMANIMGWLRINGMDKEYFNRWPEVITAVTPDEVMEAAKHVLKPENSVTSLLLPPPPKPEEKDL